MSLGYHAVQFIKIVNISHIHCGVQAQIRGVPPWPIMETARGMSPNVPTLF